MLTCKNVVVINNENDPKGEKAIVVPYDRVYFDFSSQDETETLKKNNKGSAVKLNGAEFEGTRPKNPVTKDLTQIPALLQDAVNFLVSKYGDNEDYKNVPQDSKGLLLLLHAADYGNDLWTRAKIQGDTRPAKALDPNVAREKLAKSMIADAGSRGKVLSMEKALARIAAMEAAEEEDAA